MKTPVISIIVPVYNSEEYLTRCIESVLGQDYQNIELILVNDGSQDSSLSICKQFQQKDKRVIVIDGSQQGVSHARNKGLDVCRGDYITFVDADDWINDNAISTVVKILDEQNVDCVRTHYAKGVPEKMYSTQESIQGGLYEGQAELLRLAEELLLGKAGCYVWLLTIKRSFISNLRFHENVSMMEDVIFYVELLLSVKSIYISQEITYNYYDNMQSASRNINNFVSNAIDTAKVSRYIEGIFKSTNQKYQLMYENIAAVQLSIIASRYVSYVYSAKKMVTIATLRRDLESLNKSDDLQWLAKQADTHHLKGYLRYTVEAFINQKPILLWMLILLRSIAKFQTNIGAKR